MDDEARLEGEEEMELDEASEGEDEDEETTGIPVSPANSDQLLGQSTPTTPGNITPDEAFLDPLRYQKFPLPGGKPLNIRRGPGRPRKERPLGITRGGANRRSFGRGSTRGKGLGYARGIPRRTKSKDDDTHSESPSPLRTSGADDATMDGGESGGNPGDRSMPAPEEPPYFPEQWPGKACALCNLGERSQLGQGELLRLTCPPGFTPEKSTNRDETTTDRCLIDITVSGDKSPRAAGPGAAVTCRRQKSLAKCRNTSLTNFTEPVEELTIVGYSEEPEVGALFEPLTGHYYVHQSCIIWSSNNQDLAPELTCRAVLQASCKRCAYCSHYGAGIPCKVASCNRYFHFPCAAANSCFQDTKSLTLFCSQHLGQVPLLLNGEVTCVQCYGMGDVSNLVMCSVCGQHYHGSCVGLALLPGVRAGWQCVSCRVCQVCRQPEDVSKVMLCERCDKAYHPGCLRPIVTSIPKYGWKCKCCRVCTDCGSRTPGAGLSSRWHSHYTVCDSCYQQRNKGFSCPLCRKAYRAAAYREMVQCYSCKKFVHGTCDPEADPLIYQQRKEAKPDYEYICLHCKNIAIVARRKDSIDEGDLSLSASQESLDGESSELDYQGGSSEEALYSVGLGKGKPFCATKIAKKRLGISAGILGRPKGMGKLGYQKRQKMTEFGRKRGPKAKMRGIFGLPEMGLQSPVLDSSTSKEEEPGGENKLILCSAKDKFVLTQDICVMCGAIGIDQEGCLIACAQCGQCYHPYCASVKVTKVILQKGWRCLDCTVCEGCGERNDEARLILCDDCDISYHIYCIDPPLDHVPHGTWKCKWCAQCQTCGSNDPGFNSSWQKSYTQCGPCASHTACIACQEAYQEGDLIIQCVQCERWLHCSCDSIKNETEAERCAEEGYVCLLCRPRDVPPPHLLSKPPPKFTRSSPPPQNRSPELFKSSSQPYLLDGVYLSEAGMNHIKSLTAEHQQTRKKRRKMLPLVDKEADIMATIESVVAGGSLDNSLEENNKLELMDVKDEPETVLKEGMVWNQPPPEGFSICTSENGLPVLRRKRQRNLQKLGIGGFIVRLRGTRKDKEEEGDVEKSGESSIGVGMGDDKPRRKPQRRKPKTKLAECFPLYMQEAFFGKDLMDTTKEKDLESSSESEEEHKTPGNANTIQLSQDVLKAMEQVSRAKQEKEDEKGQEQIKREEIVEDDGSDTEALGDILPISGDLLDSDLVNTIMNENDEDLAKASEALDELDDTQGGNKDELTDILSPHFNLESMVRDTGLPNMDSKDIEEIFKGVMTDESQESQESSVFSVQAQTSHPSSSTTPLVSPSPHPGIQMSLVRPQVPGSLPSVGQSTLNSPMSFPPPSPYHSEYSNSPQFSPAFSEPPSPWVNPEDEGNTTAGNATISYNQRSNLKMEADEALGTGATISSVLYANINHPEWKTEYPAWSERCKQILKKWRALSNDKKAPYLTQARDNRAAIRMKKTQQEQDRLSNRDRSSREAEQERQWKQLQALRQQQAQIQQQVIIEQRVHAIARVHRQISEETPQLSGDITSGLTTQLQVSTAQDTSQLTSLASPSQGSRSTFATPSLKAPRSLTPQSPHHQSMVRLPVQAPPCRGVRPGFPQPPSPFSPQAPQSPHDFPQSPASSQESHFQRFEGNVSTPASPYSSPQAPGTPRAPIFNPPRPPVYAPPPPATSRTPDPYSQPPATPTPSASTASGYPSPRSSETRTPQDQEVTFGQQPEVNRQLRDLLQRQQFSKKIEGVSTNWSQDGQNNSENNQQHFEANHVPLQQHSQMPSNTGEGTFRHPLPPGIIRPRLPIQPNLLIRNSIGINPRHPVAGNIQGSMDHRTKMLLQNRPQVTTTNIPQQHFQGNQNLQTRMPTVRNTIPEPYDILQQQRQFTDVNQAQNMNQRIARTTQDNLNQSIRMLNAVPVQTPLPTTISDTAGVTTSEASEIPDNVTAELEKLEQEGAGPMVEVEGVSAILGDLADDDDELLAEMGADFNILEYADPELDTIAGGEKTNILDLDLEQVEVDSKDEKQKKETKDDDQKPEITTPSSEISADSCPTSTSLTLTENSNVPTMTSSQATSQAIQAQVVQQQMHQHVQQAAAMGRPMPPGTKLLSPDGAVGVVTSTNTVTVSYPSNFPGHQQRISQAHIQVSQQQRLGMRVAGVPNRLVAVNHMVGTRMPLAPPPPPPPPPYPGPPPPYPGPIQSCSQEQPLLLEELLEQEKREQEKQQQQQQQQTENTTGSGLLSDSDFERLKADVLGTTSPPQSIVPVVRPPCVARQASSASDTNWQQSGVAADGTAKLTVAQVGARQPIATQTPPEPRVATFNIPQIPAPPTPPENIVNEQDRQMQLQYEQWLNHQDQVLKQQLHYYEGEIQKLRKIRKSLNSKQRQLRKSGNELTETDAAELQRVSSELAILQKHLDASRKQGRQHNMLIQEYQSKQQQRQTHSQPNEPCSPLMSPSQHSPMHSPAGLVSQSPGPNMIQHSPATPSIIQHSPGTPLLQHSPGNSQSTNLGTMSPHNVQQQSPRIGTPHSQGDESPFSPGPMPSPGLCNPNTTRMTSPQHRAIIGGRLATSPGAFTPETRNPQQIIVDQNVRVHNLAQRFVRPPEGTQRRGGIVYSPQPGQQQLLSQQHQQLLQRQQIIQQHDTVAQDQGQGTIARGTLQRQQVFTQQQQHENVSRQQILQQQQSDISQDGQNIVAQRNLQIAQQRQILQQQQPNDVSQEGQNVVAQRNLQMARQQIIQQQQEGISQDGQNIIAQRSMQMTQQRQQILQQTEGVVQEGQNSINQRSLQMVSQQQQRQALQQQNDITQEGQTVVTQRNLHLTQQRQQILQQQQIVQQHEIISQGISPEGQNSIGQRTLQMVQQRQQILQQQQQEDTSQDIQNVAVQRNLQIVQQRQIHQQQQHEGITQNISQDGQNVVQRTLQMTQQRQQVLQQHENISQDGQNVVAQRNLQIAQQRQQVLQQQQQILQQQQIQQQHEDVSQDGQNTITQRSLQMVQQRQQIIQQQHDSVSQIISQEGQNSIAQRSLQLAQQRQQILHQQQHEAISQEGQTSIAQRSLQITQQRQQLLQQQQHEGVSQNIPQEAQNSIGQRSLQMVQQRQHILQQQQRQQFLQMQQQQQQKPPNSPMVSQPASSPSPQLHQQLQQGYGQPPSSPMVQQVTMGSPMLQQQLNPISQPPSPMNRISPMLHGGHHHSSATNQPPSSPMMPRSPMVAGSPMQMQRRQSTGSSPAMPDRPQSVENPGTPRTPHTPHNFVQQSTNLTATSNDQVSLQILQEPPSLVENSARGGGNSNNPLNPIPFPNYGKSGYFKLGLRGGSPGDQQQIFSLENTTNNNNSKNHNNYAKLMQFSNFGRFGYFKLGLRGGSPMWSSKAESSKGSKESEISQTKREQLVEEKTNTSLNRKTVKIGSLVCADYNDFDDDSHTPPQASPTTLEVKPTQNSSLISSNLDNEPLESPGVKLEQLPDTTDYDDDKTIVNTEVTLSSAAQRDSDDITVIEQFGDSELVDVISGSLEGDMQEEYVLFEPGMVVDLSADSNDSLCHALVNDAGQSHDLVQILEIENPESQSEEPILSDEELIPSHLRNKKGLRLDIVRTLQAGKKLVAVTDTPDSPDQEELRVNPSPGSYLDQSLDQELMVSLVNESEVVIIDPTTKSPEDNLSKGSGDEDTEKIDSNIQIDVSKENTTNEGSIDEQNKMKQNKSPTNFVFSDKTSYNKILSSTMHPTSINTVTFSNSPISLTNTAISSNSNTILASISSDSHLNQISIQPIATGAKTIDQFDSKEVSSSSFSNQKAFTLSSTMASIVADAKIAAKLSQTAIVSNPQKSKLDLKIGVFSPREMPKILSSGKPSVTSDLLMNKTESHNNPTKLVLNVQPTSVTLLTPKMSIPDLSKKESILKNKEKQMEGQEGEMKKEKEEEEVHGKIKNESNSSGLIAEEKKTDPLNTTDELESMLEAIHNPAENAENKNDTPTTLKRMSPVTDDLSLVNILENDAELVENDKEQILSGSDVQKANKSKETEKDIEETSNDKNTLSNDKNRQEELCTEVENSKPFLQHCLSEEKTLMEESSDDILDMLHNIISSKPEMANSGELKSSLIYQMPTPLDTLPLNILQDPLIDVEQENLENDQLSSTEAKNQVKNQNSEMKKSPPATSQASTLVVSTVAQLQKSTTTVPHLSPLSKPTELTSNVANVSHQLRTLLSSLQSNQNTVNQTGVVTMVSSDKSGSVLSASNTLSTLNSSNNGQSGVSSLTRLDQNRSQPNSINNTIKDSELTLKEAIKESGGIITAVTKISNGEQVFRVTCSATTIQSTTVSNISSTTSTIITTKTVTTSISITSNAMLNAMLADTTSLKPSVAGHSRNNTVSTQSVNFFNSVLPSTSIQRSQSLQAILQVSSGCSTPTRVQVNTNSAVTNSMQCVRTIVPPLATSSGISGTPSILQTTLSQAPNHLLTSNQGQYKSPGLLPIDNKNNDLENQSTTLIKDPEESKVQEKREIDPSKNSNSLRLEDSQNVLLKQLLQNTVGATTSGSSQGPSLPIVPSLEAQLARPVLPTPPSLLPQLLNETPTPKPVINKQVLTRETSFLSHSVSHLKIQSSPIKEESSKSSPPLSSSIPIMSQQRGHSESLKQQATKSVSTSSGSTLANSSTNSSVKQQTVSSTITTTRMSPSISTNQQESSGQGKPGTSNDEEPQTPQRVAVSISKVNLQSKPLMASGMTSKNVQPLTNNSSNISGPQTQVQQVQNQIQVAQKPIVSQQVSSSTSSVHQQSVQQVPHSHGTIAGLPQGVTGPTAPSSSNIVPLVEVKKELGLEEVLTATGTTPTSHLQTDTKDFLTAKEELIDSAIDDKTDLKKLKRRQYQQKRKQSQGKDAVTAPQKKRSRKVSRLDEDYETFVENLMTQLRQLQPMVVLEPLLGRNYGVCPIFGCGDLVKIGSQKDYNTRIGDLIGNYGSASLPGISDHYNTQPFGELNPLSPQQPSTTQRGFYEQEFPPLKLDDTDDKKETMATNRDVDSPDTIVSSSSPECVIPEFMHHFPGLRLIEEESDDEADWLKRVSPVIPLISPIPIRLKPAYSKDAAKQDKENFGIPKLGKSPPIPLRENGNVTVTLTLNSQAADDIMGVLKDLANILNIAPPAGYQIVERTSTPPSQKLGLYRTKGKDGKEGAPVDIQSILNGATKFCRHCDIVVFNNLLIRKKVSDLPFFSKEEAEPGDELCFCSTACYMQFALIRTPSNTQDKAATIVDHLCHKADAKLLDDDLKGLKKFPIKQQQQRIERLGSMEVDKEATTEIKIKTEKLDNAENAENEEKRPKKHSISEEIGEVTEPQPPAKVWKGSRYKTWSMGIIQPSTKLKKPTDREIIEMLFRMGVTVAPAKAEDSRRCIFCQSHGDATADGPARLLNFDVDKWVHLNCALWSNVVYEMQSGALMHLDDVLQNNLMQTCIVCEKPAGTIKCYKPRCTNCYHLMCAVKDGCVFYKDKTMYCPQHILKNEKDKELITLSAYRRVYVNRDENRQVAAVMHHSEHNHLLRVGSLIFLSVGQLLPHQLQNFHTPNYIYPVGYKIVRFYWSMRRANKRCRYVCSIHDVSGRPEFRVLIQEPHQEDVELRDATPRAVWSRILEPLAELRRSTNSVQLFPRYVSGEDLFGLTEPTVVRVLESLPGIETLTDYRFKYGRNPLLELPLAINPTGSARTEARLRNQLPWKRPHTQRTGGFASRGVPFGLSTCSVAAAMGGGVSSTLVAAAAAVGETASCPYSKQFVHSKSSQYKKMKQEWRNNVYLARSKIQGLGLYAARDLEKHTMVIEYIGEIIRTELAETREKQYEARNRGIYMFRLDEERVVDATLCGGLARYINHSCNPNCVAEIVEVERDLRIIIFAKRRISRGEELAYDYKFDIEDDQHKIACACGAPNCRKWMN